MGGAPHEFSIVLRDQTAVVLNRRRHERPAVVEVVALWSLEFVEVQAPPHVPDESRTEAVEDLAEHPGHQIPCPGVHLAIAQAAPLVDHAEGAGVQFPRDRPGGARNAFGVALGRRVAVLPVLVPRAVARDQLVDVVGDERAELDR